MVEDGEASRLPYRLESRCINTTTLESALCQTVPQSSPNFYSSTGIEVCQMCVCKVAWVTSNIESRYTLFQNEILS